MTDFDAFMQKMKTLPPMGASNTQSDVEFWREIDTKAAAAVQIEREKQQ